MHPPGLNLVMPLLALSVAVALGAQTEGLKEPAKAAAIAQHPPVLAVRPVTDPQTGFIKLDIVVTDKSGKSVAGLSPKNFTVLDNGQPAKILSFAAFDGNSVQPEPPVEVILVLDTISLPDRLATYEKDETKRFLRQNGGKLAFATSIFWLSDTGLGMIAKPSSDGNLLADEMAENKPLAMARRTLQKQRGESLNSLAFEDPPGLTALNALGEIATYERQRPGRKLMLWVGPGWGTGSGKQFFSRMDREQLFNAIDWFSTLMRETRLVLYSFSVGEADEFTLSMDASIVPPAALYQGYLKGVGSDREARIDNLDRKVLAVQSGGRVLEPADDLRSDIMHTGLTERKPDFDLVSQMNGCVADGATFYSLTFDPAPTEHTDQYHDLQIEIDKSGLTAHTTTGYYDQPYFHDQPPPKAKQVTAAELGQMVRTERGGRDGDVARQLSQVELTERLSDTERSSLQAAIGGKRATAELTALADASEFLEPPQGASLADKPPDKADQRQLIAKMLEYLNKTNPDLPNFLATRSTMHFEETPEHYDEAGRKRIEFQPLHWANTTKVTVLYRKGNEIVEPANGKSKESSYGANGLITEGTFGPILGAASDAIAMPGGLTWDHWEREERGRLAVFGYAIPKNQSRFEVGYCCVLEGDGTQEFRMLAGYHGKISIDPESGAILRLTLEADLPPGLPLVRSALMVEYGPVAIGGKTYVCPARSVSMSRSRTVKILAGFSESFKTFGPYSTMLNDMEYQNYHVFRAETRVLPGYDRAVEK